MNDSDISGKGNKSLLAQRVDLLNFSRYNICHLRGNLRNDLFAHILLAQSRLALIILQLDSNKVNWN